MKSENPYDIANYFRTSGTSFHAKACLFRETGEDEDGKPLKAFNHFSRIVMTITEKSNECKFVEANIQYDDLAEVFTRANFAIKQCLKKEFQPAVTDDSEESSPAYTYVIPFGDLRGKTPVQVLQEPDGEKKLNDQYQFLQENLAKYPKNQIQMDIIMDAARLKNEGKLVKKETPITCGVIPILESEPRPNIYNMNDDGKTFPVYEVKMECNLALNSPFEVQITNYDAPVEEQTKNGPKRLTKSGKTGNKVNVIKKEAKNLRQKNFKMNMGEFTSFLDHIELAKTIFLNSYSVVLMKEAIEADKENRKKATEAKQQNTEGRE